MWTERAAGAAAAVFVLKPTCQLFICRLTYNERIGGVCSRAAAAVFVLNQLANCLFAG